MPYDPWKQIKIFVQPGMEITLVKSPPMDKPEQFATEEPVVVGKLSIDSDGEIWYIDHDSNKFLAGRLPRPGT